MDKVTEESADMVVLDLREFIKTEELLIEKEHELHVKLQSLSTLIGHLEDEIPTEMKHLRELNQRIFEGIIDIEMFIQEENLHEIKFVKEEEDKINAIEENFTHKDYQAMHKGVDEEYMPLDEHSRTEKQHLKELHHKFILLLKDMNKSELKDALKEDFAKKKTKKDYQHKEEHYFHQIYKFFRVYEHILRELWKKEHRLTKDIKKKIKKK